MLPHIKQELQRLSGKAVWTTKEPFCKQRRDMILRPESDPLEDLFLFCADRVAHVKWMRQLIDLGAVVLCDRYTDSTIAYQLYGHRLEIHPSVIEASSCGLIPALTLWFDVDVNIAMERIKERSDNDSYDRKDISFYRRVNAGYRTLYKEVDNEHIEWVNANKSIEDVKQQITTALTERFGA